MFCVYQFINSLPIVADMPGAVRVVRTRNHGEVRHEGWANRAAAAGARAARAAALPHPGAGLGGALQRLS